MASGLGPWAHRVRRTHVIPFDDHAGQRALTVFQSSSPLPFLYSFPLYFTHQDASPATSNAQELYHAVTQGPLYESNTVEYRLDLYFLPGASHDDCIAHYRGEKAARGTYQAQVDALAASSGGGGGAQPGGGASRMPGLVASYAAHDKTRFRYHGLLLICDYSPDWRHGDQLLSLVEFEPLSPEDYERYSRDPGDPREPDVLPATAVRPEAVGEGSPGYGRELPRPHFGVRALGVTLWERVPRQEAWQEAWQEARGRGWTAW